MPVFYGKVRRSKHDRFFLRVITLKPTVFSRFRSVNTSYRYSNNFKFGLTRSVSFDIPFSAGLRAALLAL